VIGGTVEIELGVMGLDGLVGFIIFWFVGGARRCLMPQAVCGCCIDGLF